VREHKVTVSPFTYADMERARAEARAAVRRARESVAIARATHKRVFRLQEEYKRNMRWLGKTAKPAHRQ
jgi:hypothetical protein